MNRPGDRDDRIRLRGDSQEAFADYVKRSCGSDFEGCHCTRPKGHTGLHRCGSVYDTCDRWTDDQAMQWWDEFRKEL